MLRWLYSLPLFKLLLHLWEKYERFITGGTLLTGFCFDLIIADRPDNPFNNILLLTYLLVAGGLIVVLNMRQMRRLEEESPAEPMLLLLMMQFLFGNLSSNLLVLYGRSGTFAGSAIFFAILAAMLIGNEFMKSRYAQLRFTIAIYYTLVFSYLIIALPTFVFHTIEWWVFAVSGAASLLYIGVFLYAVYRFILRGKYRLRHLFEVGAYVGGIFFAFNLLYIFNIIPPVPLIMREADMYHGVSYAAGTYTLTYEKPQWYEFLRGTSGTYSLEAGKPAYCWSAVFAPTGLSTQVVHSWEYFNENTHRWEVKSRITFPINGGRNGGYRGFTAKAVTAGKWRCDVETPGGQLIGRTTFDVVAGETPELSQITK